MIKETKRLGHFEVPRLLSERIEKFSSWDDKRNQFYGLSESRSILLKYNLDLAEGIVPKINNAAKPLLDELQPVIEYVQSFYGPSYCCKVILTNLPPHSEIEKHVDPGWLFKLQRRFHWAIKTNESVKLSIADQEIRIQAGDIWEIDNKSLHGAINNGDTNRIHLIFDLIVIEDVLAVTPSPFNVESFDHRFFNIVLRKKNKTGKFEV